MFVVPAAQVKNETWPGVSATRCLGSLAPVQDPGDLLQVAGDSSELGDGFLQRQKFAAAMPAQAELVQLLQ